MRVSATAPSSTLVSIWTPASMSTTRSTAPQRPRAACWGPSLGPQSLGCGQEMATATWGNCFPRRWEGSEAGPEQSPRLWKCWHVFLCSGSAAISDTWTCQSWGSLPLWWLTHLGTSTWSCPTELWLMMRWESWTSPFCKMMDSSFFGLLAGNSSFRFEEAWSLLTFVSCIIFIFWSAGQCVFFFSFYSMFCLSLTLTGRWSWAESVSVFGGKFFHWCSGSHQAHSHQLCFVLTLLPFSDTSELTRSSGWKPTSFRESSAQEGRATGWTTGRSTVWWDLILLFLSDKCDSEPLIRFVSL